MKIGRNDPCWCGSSKKYKKCHLGRESEKPLNHWEVSRNLREAFSDKYCLAPKAMQHDCTGQIIKAHTIPKSGSLKHIAKNGHVYAIIPSIESLTKHNGLLVPELIGINQASTFTGFCSKHDNTIFSKLENTDFHGTPEQLFLLGYRTVSRELFMKTSALNLFVNKRDELDKGKDIHHQKAIHEITSGLCLGMSAGLKDMKHYKRTYDDILMNGNFNNIRSYQIYLDDPPPIMASGSIFPEYDFRGNALQDLLDLHNTPQIINFTSFYGGNNGVVVFSWLPQGDEVCKKFIGSLIDINDSDLANAIIRFLFEFCENICIMPDWWDSLDIKKTMMLNKKMSNSANPNIGRSSNCLINDWVEYDTWKIQKRMQNGV